MNGDCSSATASATFSAPSNTGSPVVFMKSASTIVSCSVNVRAPLRGEERRHDGHDRARRAMAAATSSSRPA